MGKIEVGKKVKINVSSNYYPKMNGRVGELIAICKQAQSKAYVVQCKNPSIYGIFHRNEIEILEDNKCN